MACTSWSRQHSVSGAGWGVYSSRFHNPLLLQDRGWGEVSFGVLVFFLLSVTVLRVGQWGNGKGRDAARDPALRV
jgi:hypothetical protein